MKVLIACEYSGRVREAFKAKGHDAWSCDLLETEQPGQHIVGDVLEILGGGFDMLIAHPPCTYLANSGVSWFKRDPSRMDKMKLAAAFFLKLLNCSIPKRVIENPIMHKYAFEIIKRRQDQVIQPWMFGHKEQKATGLWLNNVNPLQTNEGLPIFQPDSTKEAMLKQPKNVTQRLHYLPPSPDRWKERSRTYQGIANAMAEQWG